MESVQTETSANTTETSDTELVELQAAISAYRHETTGVVRQPTWRRLRAWEMTTHRLIRSVVDHILKAGEATEIDNLMTNQIISQIRRVQNCFRKASLSAKRRKQVMISAIGAMAGIDAGCAKNWGRLLCKEYNSLRTKLQLKFVYHGTRLRIWFNDDYPM